MKHTLAVHRYVRYWALADIRSITDANVGLWWLGDGRLLVRSIDYADSKPD